MKMDRWRAAISKLFRGLFWPAALAPAARRGAGELLGGAGGVWNLIAIYTTVLLH